MAIVTSVDTFDTSSSARSRSFYRIKELLKNSAGWVVRGSSDGTTGGMDDVDRWTSETSADSTNSWLVLESPHPEPSDRIQYMLKAESGTTNWSIRYNPNADWTGGSSSSTPTSALGHSIVYTAGISGGEYGRLHVLADDLFPYGFAAYQVNRVTVPAARLALCLAPLVTTPEGAGKPYAVYAGRSFKLSDVINDRSGTSSSGWVVQQVSPGTGGEFTSAHRWEGQFPNNEQVPGGLDPTPSGVDFTFPIAFARIDQNYHGASNFARLIGPARNPYTTYGDGSRISFGMLTFPWDGSDPKPYFRPSEWY